MNHDFRARLIVHLLHPVFLSLRNLDLLIWLLPYRMCSTYKLITHHLYLFFGGLTFYFQIQTNLKLEHYVRIREELLYLHLMPRPRCSLLQYFTRREERAQVSKCASRTVHHGPRSLPILLATGVRTKVSVLSPSREFLIEKLTA